MKIEPKEGIVLIKKHTGTALQVDIAINPEEEERKLITGEILAGKNKGKTAIFGKYALLELDLKGTIYSFLDERDIIGYCDYKEN